MHLEGKGHIPVGVLRAPVVDGAPVEVLQFKQQTELVFNTPGNHLTNTQEYLRMTNERGKMTVCN